MIVGLHHVGRPFARGPDFAVTRMTCKPMELLERAEAPR